MSEFLKQEGFDVVDLSCAEDVDENPFVHTAAAYIIDLNLPGEDGLSLVERLRQRNGSATIIIASARSAIDQRVVGYEKGAGVYLTKPVNNAELVAALRANLRKSITTDFDVSLDVGSQSLFIGSNIVRLTIGETRVLNALSIAKGEFLETWQLMQLFEPDDDDFNVSQLHMRMSRLRKKIRIIGSDFELIKSERSRGYKLLKPLQIILNQ
jgi:DNA-binding response OmpR family regulator